jgi:hypothetical protein
MNSRKVGLLAGPSLVLHWSFTGPSLVLHWSFTGPSTGRSLMIIYFYSTRSMILLCLVSSFDWGGLKYNRAPCAKVVGSLSTLAMNLKESTLTFSQYDKI